MRALVRVPADAVLGGREGGGMEVFEQAMNWERIGLFAAHVGSMQRLTEISIKRARSRRLSGKPISKFVGGHNLRPVRAV